ncbi:MAG: helix-turn-helix transcriptional regulator [Bacteroidales bacterium]|nr:helix-turn-helix transcriptional regulator [Bacteroidales bacterium]
MNHTVLSQYVKTMRKRHRLTQTDLAEKAGVGIGFVRDLEQGKPTIRLDKVNQILNLFGTECGPVPMKKQDVEQ